MISIPGYQVHDKIYEGNKSTVYRGSSNTNQKLVVLKVLKNEFPKSDELAGCKREYDLIHELNIDGVIQTYELAKVQNSLAIVLEDIGGESLKSILTDRAFDLKERLALSIRIATILGQIHHHHIIHKDINPANIIWNAKTGQIKIIDFCCSNKLSRERPSIFNPNVLIGNLVYISPEQTGRMNRSVDYRSDFYSLGVTLYEIFTQKVPFETKDPAELVHCHIARQPALPHEVNPEIKPSLSAIIMKLQAKTAEDRYQSAYGLIQDLEFCLNELGSDEPPSNFIAGTHDVSSQFHIPEKFYGRDQEIKLINDSFERISNDEKELMLVSGGPGIGKTSLINEIHKPIVRKRAFFISGKFDQFQRNVPYSSLIAAFKELVRHLLSESRADILIWKSSLIKALGVNSKLIVDVIPDVESIIGPQPDIVELPPVESRNRFNLTFRQFIGVFARQEHPLVLFLDDLQWADSASLNLIQSVFLAPEISHFLLLGAFRSNEVTKSHPLELTMDKIQETGLPIQRLYLDPLDFKEMNLLISETLHCSPSESEKLTGLVSKKTNGNPLFVNQFVQSLYDNHLLEFSSETGKWLWDINTIRDIDITDNVVELMANKIQKLPDITQENLKLASCIGNQFSLSMLSIISHQSLKATAAGLWKALQEGLIIPLNDEFNILQTITDTDSDLIEPRENPESLHNISYRFLHDRVQQAAFSLIKNDRLEEINLKIGRLLLSDKNRKDSENLLFDIVNHLNFGVDLISDPAERANLASLNLRAGKRAKGSLALETAHAFFQKGIGLLQKDCWNSQYNLSLDLHVEAAETAYLNTEFQLMEKLAGTAVSNAKSILDKVRVYDIRMQSLYAQNRMKDALDLGLHVLKLLGHRFPKKPGIGHIILGFLVTRFSLKINRIEDFKNHRQLTHPGILATGRILDRVGISAYRSSPKLLPLIIFKAVRLSFRHGIAPETAFGYAGYGMFLCAGFGDIDTAYRFGKVSEVLREQPIARKMKPKSWFLMECQIKPWKRHVKDSLGPLLEIYKAGLEVGDIEYGTLATNIYCIYSFLAGNPLNQLLSESKIYTKATEDFQQTANLNYQQIVLQTITNLTENPEHPEKLSGEIYKEKEKLTEHLQAKDETAIYQASFFKMILAYLFNDYQVAVSMAQTVFRHEESVLGMFYIPVSVFYDSLAQLKLYDKLPTSKARQILKRTKKNLKKMKKWARYAPMNHLHKVHLVKAEIARVEKDKPKAIRCYNKAIKGAAKHGFIHEEAMANELAAGFFIVEGMERYANVHIFEARYLYEKWGATSKVAQLEKKYGRIIAKASARTPNLSYTFAPDTIGSSDTASDILDLTSVLKASRTISGEVVLSSLMKKLMEVVLENAGAERSFLILKEQNGLTIVAQRGIDNGPDLEKSAALNDSNDLSQMIVRYVMRTNNNVIIANSANDTSFARDQYIIKHNPKSILCMPVEHHGTLIGALYLENNTITGAFTTERIEVLQVLISQAAISIENARLYSNLKDSEEKYRSIFENAMEGIFQSDSRGKLLTLNPAFAKILGFNEIQEALDSLDNLGDRLFVDTVVKDDVLNYLTTVGSVKDYEFKCRKKDGTNFPASINAHSVLDGSGQLLYWEGILEDISEKKAAETLRIAKEAAESANQAKTEFLANMSHELRTPMHAILGFTKLGIKKAETISKEVIKGYFSEVHKSGERLLILLNDLLDLSKLEAGKYMYSFTSQNVIPAIHIVMDEFAALSEEKKITIDFQEPDSEMVITFDMEKLIQVLRNLISNAYKFSSEGGKIKIEMAEEESDILIWVVDQGLGIPTEELESVFDKFVQSSKTKTGSGGTGLGLAICKQIIKDHQGRIWAENNPDGGAKFTISLSKSFTEKIASEVLE